MEVENFEEPAVAQKLSIHNLTDPERTNMHKRLGHKKTINVPMDLYRRVVQYSDMVIDSQVHDGITLLPILINKNILIDVELLAYKSTKRTYEGRKVYCIRKFICPHHHKKNPQVRFADGILYCGRCSRVLNKDFEKEASTEEFADHTEVTYQ